MKEQRELLIRERELYIERGRESEREKESVCVCVRESIAEREKDRYISI